MEVQGTVTTVDTFSSTVKDVVDSNRMDVLHPRAEILAAVDEAEVSLARGEGRIITQESMREFAGR
jgi:hypothetical protein